MLPAFSESEAVVGKILWPKAVAALNWTLVWSYAQNLARHQAAETGRSMNGEAGKAFADVMHGQGTRRQARLHLLSSRL